MTRLVFAVVDGRPRRAALTTAAAWRETAGVIIPPLLLLGASLWLGLATPKLLGEVWSVAAQALFPLP
jgi:hydrogenase-4 component F